MSLPYYVVDAFASRLFAGNPAGVCLLDEWLPDELMQAIAAENGLSETAFVVRRRERVDLRWFTPALEVDLCGHATLGAAHVLYQHAGWSAPAVEFQTRAGKLRVMREEGGLVLDFPARPAQATTAPRELEDGLGARPIYVGKARDFLAVFASEADVRRLEPKQEILARLDCLGIIATAPGETCDFVSRFFAPRAGVPEDPVTGSAHCTLIPYWAERLGRTEMRAAQVSRRGGELFCRMRGERVDIGGQAVTYSSGQLHVAVPAAVASESRRDVNNTR